MPNWANGQCQETWSDANNLMLCSIGICNLARPLCPQSKTAKAPRALVADVVVLRFLFASFFLSCFVVFFFLYS